MRVLMYVLMIVVATVLSLGAGLLVGIAFQDAANGLLIATACTSPFLVMGPVVIGTIAGYWDHRSSAESRRFLGWWFIGVAAIDVVAAVFVVLATLSARAPVWVPVVLLLGAAVLLAVARPLGAVFRRTEPPISEHPDGSVPDARAIRSKVRTIAVTFVVSAALASVGAALLTTLGRDDGEDVVVFALLAGQLTFTATAMATVIVSLPLSRALRDAGGRDIARLRRFAKVVLRRKELPLDDADERGAVRYARLVPLALQFQIAFVGLLYVALAFQFVSQAIEGDLGVMPEYFLAALVVVLIVVVPLTARRIRRARSYVDDHAQAADDPSSPSTAGTLR
ncbi:hypothetical protein DEJ28_08745 [Curtobacterium sp. MCPF17_002]|uniref:hypothetical protein n=1 Tax=Curtobacterium sp. MCPF17_002 TaxID=2175645 RepID=UPI0011B6AA25|nr:hypothetical protein [Curtobacterium sp. MCPF17_002]WIB79172.1 hypothetical protein DEJ28_08745 [Curtobacterium sp. MCPF17_002]